MEFIDVAQAEALFSHLLERVAEGEQIVITKNGKPIAQLVPIKDTPRCPGRLKGHIHIAPDFDTPLPQEIAAAFRGERE